MIEFSFVIPTYNRSELLKCCLASILNQDFISFEIIVVDDGGDDDTKEMIELLGSEKIKYFWKKNEERCIARNFGVSHAKGQYVIFIDSDDQIEEGYFTYLHELIFKHKKSSVFHIPYMLFTNDGKMVDPRFNFKNYKNEILRQNLFAAQICLKKEVALKYPYTANRLLKIGEDWLLNIKLTLEYDWIIGEKKLGRIRQHENRTMHFPNITDLQNSKQIFSDEINNLDCDRSKKNTVLDSVNLEFDYLILLSFLMSKNDFLSKLSKSIIFLTKHKRIYFNFRLLVIIKKIFF